MAGRFIVEKAFVMSSGGILLDAGVVTRAKSHFYLYRLQPGILRRTGRGEAPEQLGLLFAAYHLKGGGLLPNEEFFIYPDALGPSGRNEADFPGLALYVRKHFTEKWPRAVEIPPDYVFGSLAFGWLFRIGYKVVGERRVYGIRATGRMRAEDVLLLDVPSAEQLQDAYIALRACDLAKLAAFQILGSPAVELLIQEFQTSVGLASSRKEGFSWDQSGQGALPAKTASQERKSPASIRQGIQDLFGKIAENAEAFGTRGWQERRKKWYTKILPKIFSGLSRTSADRPLSLASVVCSCLAAMAKDEAEAQLVLVLLQQHLGDYTMAAAHAARYCREHACDGFAWILLGHCHLALKHYAEAQKAFSQGQRAGESVAGRIGMAHTFDDPQKREEALRWIEDALREDPRNLVAKATKASWLAVYGSTSEALSLFSEVLEVRPNSVGFREGRIGCLYALGRFAEVIKEARALLREGTLTRRWTWYLLASALYSVGDYEEAKAEAHKALDAAENDVVKGFLHIILRKIAATHDKSSRDAVRHSVAVCRLALDRQTAWLYLAADLEWAGHSGMAERIWSRAIDFSGLAPGEAEEGMIVCTLRGRWDLAVKFACGMQPTDRITYLIEQVPAEGQRNLLRLVYELAVARQSGKHDGDWHEPLRMIDRWIGDISQDSDLSEMCFVLRFKLLADGACRVGDWLILLSVAADMKTERFRRLAPIVQCYCIYRLCRSWLRLRKPDLVAEASVEPSYSAVGAVMSAPARSVHEVVVARLALLAAAWFAGTDASALTAKFVDWLKSSSSKEGWSLCEVGLCALADDLRVSGQDPAVITLLEGLVGWLPENENPDSRGMLACAASRLCLLLVLKGDPGVAERLKEVSKIIQCQPLKGTQTVPVAMAQANCLIAECIRECARQAPDEGTVRRIIAEGLRYARGLKLEDKSRQEEMVLACLGIIALFSAATPYDYLTRKVMTYMDKFFLWSDRLAPMVSFYRRWVERTLSLPIDDPTPLSQSAEKSVAELLHRLTGDFALCHQNRQGTVTDEEADDLEVALFPFLRREP
jgi:tetratricopeptide (TPR) repeat protein